MNKLAEDYNTETRCKGKPNHPKCKTCERRRPGNDQNIFANPPTKSAGTCVYYRRGNQ